MIRSLRVRRSVGTVAITLAVVIALVYSAFPFYWLVISSVTAPSQLFEGALIPSAFSLESYQSLFANSPVLTWLGNSMLVAVAVTVLTVVISILGAYGLAFFETPLSRAAGNLILFTYMFPGVIIVIPAYQVLSRLGLSDSLVGLILVELVLTVPFCIWMLRSFFVEVPKEIIEAGRIDGASRMRVLWDLLVPIMRPGIVAIAVFAFIFSWNEYLFPLVLVNSDAQKTLPLGVAGFMGNLTVEWGPLLASGVVAVIPVFVLFLFLQRQLINGLMSGAVKG